VTQAGTLRGQAIVFVASGFLVSMASIGLLYLAFENDE